jgi:SAM-dependent methyltransferase
MRNASHPRPPVDPARLNATADTMWMNLGWWPGAASYGDAAQALACRVGEAAGLRAGDVVVDYACGYGDSLRLWVERFGVASVVGVEPDPAVTAIVERRIAAWGLAGRIRIVSARAEPTPPRALAADVSAVVSVDAAYHFHTRHEWLAVCLAQLPVGGRIGTADLVCTPRGVRSWSGRLLARAMRIPHPNLQTSEAISDALVRSGARILRDESAGGAVLDGFATFAPGTALAVRATRTAIRAARQYGLVDYRIVGVERAAPRD